MKKEGSGTKCRRNHYLDQYLETYITGAELEGNPKGILFRSAKGQTGTLTEQPMTQADACRMIRIRARNIGIMTKIGIRHFGQWALLRISRMAVLSKSRSRLPRMSHVAQPGLWRAR